jgi:hypothetical protein
MSITPPHFANFPQHVELKLQVLESPLAQELVNGVNASPVFQISVELSALLSSLNNTDFYVAWVDDLIAEGGLNWTHFHYPNTHTPTAYMGSTGTYVSACLFYFCTSYSILLILFFFVSNVLVF